MERINFAIFALVLAFLASLPVAQPAYAGAPGYRAGQATAMQILALPKFCWWEYDKKYASTQQLVQNCGPYMNHYCSGEIDFMNSKDLSRAANLRLDALNRALTNTEYTLNGMQTFPACSIRSHVVKKYGEIRASYIKFGKPMPANILNRR